MAYVERDDRDLDLNDEADFYEEDDIVYESESFGERIDRIQEEDELDTEDETVDSSDASKNSSAMDDGFGEAISPETNMQDEQGEHKENNLDTDTESAGGNEKSDSVLKKAKGKLDEWTDKDQRE